MKPLLAVVVLLAAGCTAASTSSTPASVSDLSLEGYSGTELCAGCRLEQRVKINGGARLVLEQAGNACSEWVSQHVPDHVHVWSAIGGWSDGNGIACTRAGWPLIVNSEQWLAYVQRLPERRQREVIAEVAGGNEQQLRECQAWAAQSTASRVP